MKQFVLALVLTLISDAALAWNLDAKNVNALRFEKSGRIQFTLFTQGTAGSEFFCKTGAARQWFVISPCVASDTQCVAASNRMASMLLSAKLAGTAVHVQRSACAVTEVALKP